MSTDNRADIGRGYIEWVLIRCSGFHSGAKACSSSQLGKEDSFWDRWTEILKWLRARIEEAIDNDVIKIELLDECSSYEQWRNNN